MKDYCETFHLIYKGNGAEAHDDMGGNSPTHNWSPKLVFRLWNMSMHNAYKIYSALNKQYTPNQKRLSMKQCVKELTFDLLQRGDSMRERKAEHPGYTVDLSMRTVCAGGGHGPILLGKSEAGGGSIVSTQRPTNSYVNLQGDFLHRAEIFYIGHVKISDFGKKKCN